MCQPCPQDDLMPDGKHALRYLALLHRPPLQRPPLQSESDPHDPHLPLEQRPTLQSESDPQEPHFPDEHRPKPAQSESEPQLCALAWLETAHISPTAMLSDNIKRNIFMCSLLFVRKNSRSLASVNRKSQASQNISMLIPVQFDCVLVMRSWYRAFFCLSCFFLLRRDFLCYRDCLVRRAIVPQMAARFPHPQIWRKKRP